MITGDTEVYPTSTVLSLWARQTQHYARNRQDSLYFDGPYLVSHRRAIGHMVQDQSDERVALVASYSGVLEKRHLQAAEYACHAAGVPVYRVPYQRLSKTPIVEHSANIKYMLDEYADRVREALRGSIRYMHFRLSAAERVLATAREYATRFGVTDAAWPDHAANVAAVQARAARAETRAARAETRARAVAARKCVEEWVSGAPHVPASEHEVEVALRVSPLDPAMIEEG